MSLGERWRKIDWDTLSYLQDNDLIPFASGPKMARRLPKSRDADLSFRLNPRLYSLLLVAGAGFEPTTFGL